MRTRPNNESLGVVAMSRPQQEAIQAAIDNRRLMERDLDPRFDTDLEEHFFVKNLESVQGDERDRMIMCVGYGPTEGSGAVPPNRFGPINGENGSRRINVAITRARKRFDVVHSIQASDIRSTSGGGLILKRFLEYARNPSQYFEAQQSVDVNADTESLFEEWVATALRSRGHKIQLQIGVSGYRIDLAVMSEDVDGYDLGIECDGKMWHSTPAARDRDWMRQEYLERLGWTIHRVWSTSWIRDPQGELNRIEQSLEKARSKKKLDLGKYNVEQNQGDIFKNDNVIHIESESYELIMHKYETEDLQPQPSWKELKHETTHVLEALIRSVARTEGPVHIDQVIDRIRIAYGLGSVRTTTRQHLLDTINAAKNKNLVIGDGDFIWSDVDQLDRNPRVTPPDGKIQHIHPRELRHVIIAKVRELESLGRETLVTEVARSLEFKRTGNTIRNVLNKTIQGLIDEKQLEEDSSGYVNLPQ